MVFDKPRESSDRGFGRAAERVRAEVSGLPPGKWERRLFMVMQSFFDESGNAPDQVMLVMGGLLAPAVKWIEFTSLWDAALRRAPGAEYVKYREIVRGEGQFADSRGWTDEKRTQRLGEFAEIIQNHCTGFLYTAMEHEHFAKHVRSVPAHHRNALTDSPYPHVALKSIGPTMSMLMDNGLTDPCDFYFDEMPGPDLIIQEMWPSVRTLPSEMPDDVSEGRPLCVIGNLRFGRDTEFLPLQGADIIAGMMRDVLMMGMTHKALKPLENFPNDGQILDEEDVLKTGQMLRTRVGQLIEEAPSTKLFAYDKRTAARTRKMLERRRREAAAKKD